MKKLILLSLFSVFGMVADRPNMKCVEDEFNKARMEGRKVNDEVCDEALPKVEKKLLQETEVGKIYSSVRKNLSDCETLNGHGSSACNQIRQNLEHALARVQQTPAYKEEYLPALRKKDYYSEKFYCLELMVGLMGDESHKSQSEEDVLLKAINELKEKPHRDKPSTVWVEWSNDLVATQGKVKEDLRNFVREVIEK